MTAEVAGTAEGWRRLQSDEAARGQEQARTMRLFRPRKAAKQIKLITKANVEHSTVSHSLLRSVDEIRQITNALLINGMKQTRGGTADVLRRAQGSSRWPSERPNGRASKGHR